MGSAAQGQQFPRYQYYMRPSSKLDRHTDHGQAGLNFQLCTKCSLAGAGHHLCRPASSGSSSTLLPPFKPCDVHLEGDPDSEGVRLDMSA
jgi:hypothetical protein